MDSYKRKVERTFIKENMLYEGLIKSHPLEHCISILSKNKYSVKQNSDANCFFLTHTFDNDYYSALIELTNLLSLTNNLGWYPTNMTYGPDFNDTIKWDKKQEAIKRLFINKYKTIKFLFEPKYDTQALSFEARLYHITPTIYVEKILKNGLVPKSRSKKAYHPERVYLSRTLVDAQRLIPIFKANTEIDNWTILMVDTILLNNLHLYKDQNFKDRGYWTLNTISPASLKVYVSDNSEIFNDYANREDHKSYRGYRKNRGDKTPNYEY